MRTFVRFLFLLTCLVLTGRAERRLSIGDYSDLVRTHVVGKMSEALGEKDVSSVEISGVVTFQGDGFFFLQRDADGLKIRRTGSDKNLNPGDVVLIRGTPMLEGGRVILNAVHVEKTGREDLPDVRCVTSDDLLYEDDVRTSVNGVRIRISGRAIGLTDRGFAIDVEGVPINVMCARLPDFLSDSEHTHPKLELTGVAELMLDQSSLMGGNRDVIGIKIHARPDEITLKPDLAYYAARRTRHFMIGATLVSVALGALLVAIAVLAFRQRRRLFRSRTLMGERKRMADDLHDTIEQHLVGAGMLLKLGRTKEAEDVLVRAKREIRDIVWGLKNDDMMRLSPADMLRHLAHEENTKGLFRVDTKLAGLPVQMDASRMRDLSLIVREAIGNALKHGGAKKIAISADPVGADGWWLRIANDGKPFDPQTAPGATEGHFGLEGMRQRARRLGLEIAFSQQGVWTVLSLRKESEDKA